METTPKTCREIKLVSNMAKFYMLMLLSDGPKHGYELMKSLEDKMERRVSPAQTYPFLRILEKLGYLKSKKTGNREKRTYALTVSGREFVRHVIGRFGELIDIAVRPRLTVCAHCGCRVYNGGHLGRDGRKFCCKYCEESAKTC